MEKYGRSREATGENIAHAHYMWITGVTNGHLEYFILIAFQR